MKKAIGAILFHCTEMNDESSCHRFCPQIEVHGANGSMTNLKGLTYIRVIFPYQSGLIVF